MHDLIRDLDREACFSSLLIESGRPAAGDAEISSPYDGEILATVPTGGTEHADDALTVAHALFRDRDGWLPIPRRIEILSRTADLMDEQRELLTVLAASEGGKPYRDSAIEIARAIDGVQLAIETLRGHPGPVIPIGTTPATSGRVAFTIKEPIGVVLAVSAFNHPLNLIVHQVAPAVAAGCPVIVKPAGDTALSCLKFVQLLRDAGLPPAWAQAIVADSNETAGRLVTDSRVAFFSFIGSARVGWMLRSQLAAGTRCALEHGGAAPVILADEYDFDLALASIAKGGFYHAGQVCVSVQRVFAPKRGAKRFAKTLARVAKGLVVGDPVSEATDVGPLIRPGEVERIAEWVDEAVSAGAKLLCGGKALDNNCYAPTVLLDPARDARVSTEEIFGPVVCVYSYEDVQTAYEQANALPFAFQAAVFSRDIDKANEAFRYLDATAVMINDHSAFRDDVMPFAGLRESGLGIGGIPYTMKDMQIEKMMVIRSPAFD